MPTLPSSPPVQTPDIHLLGDFRLTYAGAPPRLLPAPRVQALLAYLVLHRDAPQPRQRLAFLLWPESSESQARTNLRQLLHHLRRALPPDCALLTTDNQAAHWRCDAACAIDVTEFETAAARATEAQRRGDLADEQEALECAARLYHDDLLPELFDEWLSPKREQLRESFASVLSRLATLLEATGNYPAAIRQAERLIALDPLREPYYQALIRLHALNQDRSSALRVYHQLMRELKRELGVTPGKATRELFAKVLKSE